MDLRLIIGRLLLAIGALLIIASKLAPATVRTQLYGANLNLAWGIVLIACGLLFTLTAKKSQ